MGQRRFDLLDWLIVVFCAGGMGAGAFPRPLYGDSIFLSLCVSLGVAAFGALATTAVMCWIGKAKPW